VEARGDSSVTDLIRRARQGDPRAVEALLESTYSDLRVLARSRLRAGGRSVMLDTGSLVHEWYLRFAAAKGAELRDRAHFMRYAAKVMRSVIVDFARSRNSARRGSGATHGTLTVRIADRSLTGEQEIVRVHETLEALSELDPRMAQIVEMRFFAGMSEVEIGEALELSERTVRREWTRARLWLAEALS
jgi:RNA polymerase sigma factor (TIGR02999 family)